MKIIVCIKPVNAQLVFDKSAKRFSINPYDYFALKQASKIKKSTNCTITGLIMGIADNRIGIEAEVLGCDQTIFLSDNKFAGADTLATSYVLAQAIKKIGDFDYLFFGNHSVDGETGHVGISVAERLNLPFLSRVEHIEKEEQILFSCIKQKENIRELIQVNGKAAIIFHDFIVEEPKLNIMQLRNVNNRSNTIWDHRVILANLNRCGTYGSKTKVLSATSLYQSYKREQRVISGSDDDKADEIISIVKEFGQ